MISIQCFELIIQYPLLFREYTIFLASQLFQEIQL